MVVVEEEVVVAEACEGKMGGGAVARGAGRCRGVCEGEWGGGVSPPVSVSGGDRPRSCSLPLRRPLAQAQPAGSGPLHSYIYI